MAQDLHEVGVRVEELLAELRSESDPTVHQRAEALVSLLVEFYGAGLERALALVAREPSGDLINRRLAQDDLLGSLFSLHGIHPVPVEDRVHEALTKAGVKVPEQCSVAGFDDVALSALSAPSLTTVRQPFEQSGRIGARALVQHIEDSAHPPQAIQLGLELIRRAST